MRRRGLHLISSIAMLLHAGTTWAQVSPEEHAQHHPEAATGEANPEAQTPNGMAGMGEMMSRMGVPPPKQIYPRLMDLPSMTLEERDELERLGHERMQSGTALMGEGFDDLLRVTTTNDFAAMQAAIAKLREGVSRYDSGLAAHRALAEGIAPDRIAMDWFKREMNLQGAIAAPATSGPMGLSWPHLIGMSLLAMFAAVMIGLYYVKMRRATGLLTQLAGSPLVPPPDTERKPGRASAAPAVHSQPAAPAPTAVPPAASASRRWTGELRLDAVFEETTDISTFRLVNPGGGMVPFEYVPGQFLTLNLDIEGTQINRSYTIASSPTRAASIEISVKREEHGVVSRFLHDSCGVGDLLSVSAPSGVFTFDGDGEESIVLISGGVGITPMMSVIRYLTDTSWHGHIYLLHCCRTTDDFCFRHELELLQRRHPRLNVTATMTRARGSSWVGATGRLSAGLIQECVPDIASKLVHLCGPPGMMDALKQTLQGLGVPANRIKTEAFGPAVQKPASAPATITDSEVPGSSEATVRFTVSQKDAPLAPEATVLEAAESVGVEIENSCRAGTCGTCKVRLLKGVVQMDVEDALDDSDRRDGIILACQAKSEDDLEVEA